MAGHPVLAVVRGVGSAAGQVEPTLPATPGMAVGRGSFSVQAETTDDDHL